MAKILLDTSIIVDFLRQKDKSKTILYHLGRDKYDLCVSIITHTESYAGKSVWEKEDARQTLEILFSNIKILPLEEESSKKAGEIRARYGTNIVDAIIAATALFYKLELATLNIKDFENIKGMKLLKSRQLTN